MQPSIDVFSVVWCPFLTASNEVGGLITLGRSVTYLQVEIVAEFCSGLLAPCTDVSLSEDHFVPEDSILVVLLLVEELLEAVAVVVVL